MSKKIIVSGVTGQDGSYMVDYLLANTDHLIWGMVRRTSKPDLGNLKAALTNPRFKTIVADLTDSASIDNVVKEVKPDYFINLAAQSFVGSSWQIPEQTFDVDAVAIIRILEAIRKHVPHCRFYNAGSSEEHGDVQYSPQDINHPLRARSPYGAAKIAARQIVKVYRESYGLYAIQGLLYNHESERRGEEFVTRKITLGVARVVREILGDGPITPIELGNLDAKRDWSHAEDFVDGIWKMLNQWECRLDYKTTRWKYPMIENQDNPDVQAEIDRVNRGSIAWLKEYLLSSGETHTVRSFIEKAFRVAGISGEWRGTGVDETYVFTYGNILQTNGTRSLIEPGVSLNPVFSPIVRINPAFYRPADVEYLLGDSSPARQELGWMPKISFDDLVRRMTESDLKNVGIIV